MKTRGVTLVFFLVVVFTGFAYLISDLSLAPDGRSSIGRESSVDLGAESLDIISEFAVEDLANGVSRSTSCPEGEYAPGELLIKFKENVGLGSQESSLRTLSYIKETKLLGRNNVYHQSGRIGQPGPEVYDGLGRVRVDVEERSLEEAKHELEMDPKIESVDFNWCVNINQFIPNDSDFGNLWGMHNTGQTGGTNDADIDAPEAWEVETGSSQVIVAVIDTGVDYTHPDLESNIWVNPGEVINGQDDDGNGYVDDIRGWDFINNDNNPMDDHFHGTHVAGTIGAVGNNGEGVAGVVWNVQIMPLKFLGASGGGNIGDALEAVQYATLKGAHVMSNSWGGGGGTQDMQDAINEAYEQGILFVAAAGNDDADTENYFPAGYDNVLTVAATDHNDNKASFSNWGDEVEVSAPGVSIYSTWFPGYGYNDISGTSMATPHVSGLAALLKSRNPSLTLEEIMLAMQSTADDLGQIGWDPYFGSGRINAFSALQFIGAGEGFPAVVISSPQHGESFFGNGFEVYGSANSTNFSSYSLEYAFPDDEDWRVAYSSEDPVVDGFLGQINVLGAQEGPISVRLVLNRVDGVQFQYAILVVLDNVVAEIETEGYYNEIGSVPIEGRAFVQHGGEFHHYELEYGEGVEPDVWYGDRFDLVNNGEQPVEDWGLLGTFDITELAGFYAIRVRTFSERCVADISGNGKIDAEDLTAIILHWHEIGESVFDLTGDDYVNTEDLVEVILQWGVCGESNQPMTLISDELTDVVYLDTFTSDNWPVIITPADYGSRFDRPVPSVGDIDGDGSKEIVVAYDPDFAVGNQVLRAYDADANLIFSEDTLAGGGIRKRTHFAFANLSAAQGEEYTFVNKEEISTPYNSFTMSQNSVIEEFSYQDENVVGLRSSVAEMIYDVNGDGELDKILPVEHFDGAGYTIRLNVRESDGGQVSGFPFIHSLEDESSARVMRAGAVGDLDNDLNPEIFFSVSYPYGVPKKSMLFGLNHLGSLLPGFPIEYLSDFNDSSWYSDDNAYIGDLAIVDVTGDGEKELIFNTMDLDHIVTHAINKQGQELENWPQSEQIYFAAKYGFGGLVALGDLTGDDVPEIVVGTKRGSFGSSYKFNNGIIVYEGSGEKLFTIKNDEVLPSSIFEWYPDTSGLAVVDVDFDFKGEIIAAKDMVGPVASGIQGIIVYDDDGTVLEEIIAFPAENQFGEVKNPISEDFSELNVVDIDNDCTLEVTKDYLNSGYIDSKMIYVWDLPYLTTQSMWTTFQGNRQRTGEYSPEGLVECGCVDSDGGSNYEEKGEVCIDGDCFVDECIGEGIVIEYICVPGGEQAIDEHECDVDNQEICIDGACVYVGPQCGDGIVDGNLGEQCDDGDIDEDDSHYTINPFDDDGMCVVDLDDFPENSCKWNVCGDGYLDDIIEGGDEYCDDGNLINGDGCEDDCTISPNIIFEIDDPDGDVPWLEIPDQYKGSVDIVNIEGIGLTDDLLRVHLTVLGNGEGEINLPPSGRRLRYGQNINSNGLQKWVELNSDGSFNVGSIASDPVLDGTTISFTLSFSSGVPESGDTVYGYTMYLPDLSGTADSTEAFIIP